MGILDEEPEAQRGLLAAVADWWNRGGLAGSMGMEPVDQQIAGYQRRRDEMRQSGAGMTEQLLAGRDNPMLQAFGPESLAGSLGAALMFAGKGAKTANLLAQSTAEAMAKKGASRDEIWSKTGWFQGPDQKWRFEIDDSKARPQMTTQSIKGEQDQNRVYMSRALKHDDLYGAYPEARTAGVRIGPGPDTTASYNSVDDVVTVNAPSRSTEAMIPRPDVMLHELQHSIQSREGFAPGGSVSTIDDYKAMALAKELLPKYINSGLPYERAQQESLREARSSLYRRLAGEAEARNVQTRMNMTPDQRRATPPWATLDVPEDQLIVRGLLD